MKIKRTKDFVRKIKKSKKQKEKKEIIEDESIKDFYEKMMESKS